MNELMNPLHATPNNPPNQPTMHAVQQLTKIVAPKLAQEGAVIALPQERKEQYSTEKLIFAYKQQDPQGFASLKQFLTNMDAVLDPLEGAGLLKDSTRRALASVHLATIAVDVGLVQAMNDMSSCAMAEPSALAQQQQMQNLEQFLASFHAQVQAQGGIEKAQRYAAFLAETDEQAATRLQKTLDRMSGSKMLMEQVSHFHDDARAGFVEIERIAQYTLAHIKSAPDKHLEKKFDALGEKVAQLSEQIRQAKNPDTHIGDAVYAHRLAASEKDLNPSYKERL